ncbi:response regulator [Acidihalobacter ferrooxydans]|uniref:Diguanylate cyclase response regulator n=1 Tax=Acidihalobacter ferrooxydans TaxID=1765967 RepID=A0A1P8UIX9_9GAMM|nr:response regulator [Acidihalobacter ferrooxydans]APZ43805.1 hypothetical protein BW247_12500 [Acidihalobacter ferrooxydans]
MSQTLSIIIVDDMQFSRAVLRNELRKLGYDDIRLAASGDEVLRMCNERYADLILADWVMPTMNGLQLLKAVRQQDQARDWYTAFILFTAKEEQHAMLEAFRHGVDDYLVKPVQPDELAARVYGAGRISNLQNGLLQTSNALHAANRELLASNQIDALTGLGNRHYAEQRLHSMLRHTRERTGALCGILIRINELSHIRETYGHDCVDELLTSFTLRLRNSVRPTDVIARYAKATFAVLTLHGEQQHACDRQLKNLIQTLGTQTYQTSCAEIAINISAGINVYRHGAVAVTPDDFLLRAERNLAAFRQADHTRSFAT